MENFAREFMTKLDGKIPNEIMRIVLNELEKVYWGTGVIVIFPQLLHSKAV